MEKELFSLVKMPSLWQRSSEPFWDDEHISKGMLQAHLDPDREAASRKKETIERSVKWLSTVIPKGSKILDLGCGPGLYTKRLSALGYNVTGMDFSKRSIEYARAHDLDTEYIFQNYLELDFTSEFDVITLIYCDYAALTQPERKILLSKIYKALKPNGLFIFDVFTNTHFKSKANKTSWYAEEDGGFWSPEPYICLEATHLYENNTVSVNQYIIITSKGISKYLIWDTAYDRQSLTDEIAPYGFHVNGVFSDVCGRPCTDESDTLCFIASKHA